MEEYTEKQVLEQVEKDLSGGVFSPESIYMRKDLLAKDTGRSLEDTWFEPKLRSGLFIHEI